MKASKPLKTLGLALVITGLGFLFQRTGGPFQVWNSELEEMSLVFLLYPSAFIIGFILILSSGKKGAEHFSNGCALGAILLMALLGLIAFAYLLEIGSWA